MSQSAVDRIESIVGKLQEKGNAEATLTETSELSRSQPEAVKDLAVAVMRRFPRGGTFLDAALSFMPQDHWPGLVQQALDELEITTGKNKAAEAVIEYASLQCPTALHPHLDRIFKCRPNANGYDELYPWRESGDTHFAYLQRILDGNESTDSDRRRAWQAMLETRHTEILKYALARAETVAPDDWELEAWVKAHLHLIGFDCERETLRRLCSDTTFHIQFPNDFFGSHSRPSWLAKVHPTWCISISEIPAVFGGMSPRTCSVCGHSLHRLVAFNAVPPELGITGLPQLEIATCLSCLGWERQPLFYAHQLDGSVVNIGYEGAKVTPQFPVGPLRQCEINIVRTPARWLRQSWGSSNGRENLNRIGGEPTWIQDAEFPHCPTCSKVMTFLLQLDSDLTTADGGEWLWGSGGIAYACWCNDCKVSGLLWQCT